MTIIECLFDRNTTHEKKVYTLNWFIGFSRRVDSFPSTSLCAASVLVRAAVNLSWRGDFERTAQFLPQLFFAGVLLRCIFFIFISIIRACVSSQSPSSRSSELRTQKMLRFAHNVWKGEKNCTRHTRTRVSSGCFGSFAQYNLRSLSLKPLLRLSVVDFSPLLLLFLLLFFLLSSSRRVFNRPIVVCAWVVK